MSLQLPNRLVEVKRDREITDPSFDLKGLI